MSNPSQFQDPQIIYDEWRLHPDREVWVVDETKMSILDAALKKKHSEIISYTLVRLKATDIVETLHLTDDVRDMLPGERDVPFKSGDLQWAYKNKDQNPAFAAFTNQIAKPLMKAETVQFVTTLGNIDRNLPAVKRVSSNDVGPPITISKSHFSFLEQMLVDRAKAWAISTGQQVDVLVDRSQALGLDPLQMKAPPKTFNVISCDFGDKYPHFKLIATSDQTGPFKDVLLLPDYFGYLVRLYRNDNISQPVLDAIYAENPWNRIVPYDLRERLQRTEKADDA